MYHSSSYWSNANCAPGSLIPTIILALLGLFFNDILCVQPSYVTFFDCLGTSTYVSSSFVNNRISLVSLLMS